MEPVNLIAIFLHLIQRRTIFGKPFITIVCSKKCNLIPEASIFDIYLFLLLGVLAHLDDQVTKIRHTMSSQYRFQTFVNEILSANIQVYIELTLKWKWGLERLYGNAFFTAVPYAFLNLLSLIEIHKRVIMGHEDICGACKTERTIIMNREYQDFCQHNSTCMVVLYPYLD